MNNGATSYSGLCHDMVSLVLTWRPPGARRYWYGFSLEVHHRFWSDIADRVQGPMTFRFYLQPTMALIAAIPDGINDARNGRSAFF